MSIASVIFGSLPFIVPTIVLCILDFVHAISSVSNPHAVQMESLTLAYFLGFVSVIFVSYRFVVHFRRKRQNNLNDASRLLYDVAFVYVSGGVRAKIDQSAHIFIPLFFVYLATYTVVFEWCGRDIIVANENDTHIPRIEKGRIVRNTRYVTWIAVLCLALLSSNLLWTAWRVSVDYFIVYITVFFTTLCVGLALCLRAKTYHLHHWFTSLLAVHACVFTTDVSVVAQAMFLATYVHGMAVFGADAVFT